MTTDKTIFIVVKLSTGETILATMVEQDDRSLTIEYPLEMKWTPSENAGGVVEYKLTAMTYCPFTVDRTFIFRIGDIQHVNHMNQTMIESYMSLVMVKPKEDGLGKLDPVVDQDDAEITSIDPGRIIH